MNPHGIHHTATRGCVGIIVAAVAALICLSPAALRAQTGPAIRLPGESYQFHYGPGGSRTIVRERANHSRVVSDRFGHGYVEWPFMYHGAALVNRTYYAGGVAYSRVYRPYVLGGVAMNVYAPGFLYAPAFYGWAYNSWAPPINFGWGWAGSSWYGYYGGYFTPFPAYASPSLWLTDYLLAQTLQAAYQERPAELANAQANFTPMTSDVKQQIAGEVRRQIALENSQAAADSFSGYPRPPGAQTAPDPGSSGIARMLSDNMAHVFVVSAALDVQSNPGECSITEGDVLRLSPGARPYPSKATLTVLASKGQDCQRGTPIVVGLADLQDMQNQMRETLDLGLAELQKQQGQNGIPVAPAAAAAPPVQTAYAASAPPPDPNVASILSAQTKEADLTVGQTPDEAIAMLGQPVHISDAGAKKIYVFNGRLEVTFINGKVSAARHLPGLGVLHRMPPPPPPQPKLEKGLTIDQVAAQLGQPQTTATVGEKQIYLFKEWKVTFIGGKVTDIDVR